MEEWESIKQNIGVAAAHLAPKAGIIGLGSGSTSALFVKALASRYRAENLDIFCVATSKSTEHLARDYGLPVLDEYEWDLRIDIAFDGADAVDTEGTAIKGAGGRLLREKIVASAAKRVILMVDERKWQRPFVETPLPVAVVPFGWKLTNRAICELGFSSSLRKDFAGSPYITDDGLYILDLRIPKEMELFQTHDALKRLTGVVETGIFLNCATEIIVGHADGRVSETTIKKWQ